MNSSTDIASFQIRSATKADVPVILSFIKKLADYERLSHEVVARRSFCLRRFSAGAARRKWR